MPNIKTNHRHKHNTVSVAAKTLWWEVYELWDQMLLGVGSIYDRIVNKPNYRIPAKGQAKGHHSRSSHRHLFGMTDRVTYQLHRQPSKP
jgi:hypothetical protein